MKPGHADEPRPQRGMRLPPELVSFDQKAVDALPRCSRCILPETFPFISFDHHGVCNYCNNYRPLSYRGAAALEQHVRLFRRKPGPDCLVALSGGRDSSYALHYMKKVLGMDPVAFTYDWGMVNGLAARNITRLCGSLGVKHIVIRPDIRRKLRNIRSNLLAWLKQPDLGMVPLFMAGDKHYFLHANRLMKKYGTGLLVMAENRLELTHFKHGFCGVRHNDPGRSPYAFSISDKLALAFYYLSRFAANPRYINASLFDSFGGYIAYYFLPHNYCYLYSYIPWYEGEIVGTLRKEYGWETAPDTVSTWRIGDGTSAFYNYIYLRLAGFTENDTFRSNQIREGLLAREQGLAMARQENSPRAGTIECYLNSLGLDPVSVINRINEATPIYRRTSMDKR